LEIKKWQACENPLRIRSSLAFKKLVVTYEITTPVAAIEQPPNQQVLPYG